MTLYLAVAVVLIVAAAVGLYWLIWATLTGRITWRTGAEYRD